MQIADFWKKRLGRRKFLKASAAGLMLSLVRPWRVQAAIANPLFWITRIPNDPFTDPLRPHHHAGVDSLLQLMGENGLQLYRSAAAGPLAGPAGLIAPDDVVLIKVNAQWKYRGCTNSDVIRGLIQAILEHPDGFSGEVVLFENGQGRGSLKCDNGPPTYADNSVQANANNSKQSFAFLVENLFKDPRVSATLLDPVRSTFIAADDHVTDGYRIYENVSYPCFTTAGGNRVELREGLWQGSGFANNLKLISVPILKNHGGSGITGAMKHVYGIVSMKDGQSPYRHYKGLGETCGKMMASVRTPVLTLLDAIWVSHRTVEGYPPSYTFRTNQLLASQDPVALDYCAAKYLIYPIDENPRHYPNSSEIKPWLDQSCQTINDRGGLYHPESGIQVGFVTQKEAEMRLYRKGCVPDMIAADSLLLDD